MMRHLFKDLRQVIQTLKARKMRTFLTMLGIDIGVAGVIIIIALGAGAQSLVLSQVTKIGTNLIAVLPGKSDESGPPSAVFGIQITTLVNSDVDALNNKNRVPHATHVVGLMRGAANVVWRNINIDTNFIGTQTDYKTIHDLDIESGRFFTQQEELGANVIVLGYDVKEQIFGDSDPLGQVVKIKNVPFEVIGVAKKKGSAMFMNQDDQVYLPLIIGQKQILGINHLQFIRARVDSSKNIEVTKDDMAQVLRERHNIKNPEDDDFSIRDLASAIDILKNVTNSLSLFLTVMAGLALVIGGIGIMNIMLVTVAERTREIGLRKAVGANNKKIRNQFLFESGALTLVGGIGGIILGTIVSFLFAVGARYAGFEWSFVVSYQSIGLAVGVSILTGVIFGLYPAYKASKLNPIDALRYE
jgi:putative ABC transport system permease protein